MTVDDDLEEFYRLARKDPILRHTVDDLYGMHDTNPATLFCEATLAALLQMAPLKRSEGMMRCAIRKFGQRVEVDGRSIYVWPTPEKIVWLNKRKLDGCRLGYRTNYVLKLAQVLAAGGFPTIEELRRLDPEDAKRSLLELPGIGEYSADIINPHGGFPVDAWSADVFGKLFFGSEFGGGREAIGRIKAEGIHRWGKYSWLAFLYVVHDLDRLLKKLGTTLSLQ